MHDYSEYELRARPHVSARSDAVVSAETAARFRISELEGKAREPFVGITSSDAPPAGLFPMQSTAIDSRRLREAADRFLDSLGPAERADIVYDIDSVNWRRWSNIHGNLFRHGLCLDDLGKRQRRAALEMIAAALSLTGFAHVRAVMRINEYVADLTRQYDQFGEWLYYVSVFGTPSATRPWGWQIDGHHLNVNCFVLGSQVVLTPLLLGSEPMTVPTGKFAGTTLLRSEEAAGLMLAQSLTPSQTEVAVIDPARSKNSSVIAENFSPNLMLAEAFRDNIHMAYEGILATDLSGEQQTMLWTLIRTYTDWSAQDIRTVKNREIEKHFDETHFVWMGARDGSPFYYRIQNPVVAIEFNHQSGVIFETGGASPLHTHAVIRTPNGNDYGKDLLRQHFERHRHDDHGHHQPHRVAE